jgi:enoyl-CoA hydratase/carnithine racemase
VRRGEREAMGEIMAALRELGADERVRAILVRGEARAFSAGLKASAERDMSTIDRVQAQMELQFDLARCSLLGR